MSVPLTEQVMQDVSLAALHDPCRTRILKASEVPGSARGEMRKGGRRAVMYWPFFGACPVARSLPPRAPPQSAQLAQRPPERLLGVGPRLGAPERSG